ncbi:Retrovirus-related Pol polyprotein from transposon TNT 1-94 [Cucumis melo var. makuwa]|nr:Retrovirus-related Pol polyprotein from transposon TNT 1-94 [Cucumis melo var. makuwa]
MWRRSRLHDGKVERRAFPVSVGLARLPSNQLHNSLVNLNQEVGQSVNEYLAVLQPIWTQLDQAKISKDHLRLIKVLMGLRPEYESVRAALLHRSPLPSLDAVIQEILFEEKRLGINLSKHYDVVLAGTYSPSEHQTYFVRILISSSSSTLAVSPGNRWLLNSVCCNHMTSNYSLMNTPSPANSLPPIYAADGNCMNTTHIDTINTPNLNLSHTYCVLDLTFNLVSVGQLCDLGLTVTFSPNGCQVQDPQTRHTIRTGHKVRRLFELLSLQVPPPSPISAPITDSDTYQWHLRLGHASPEKLHHLISINNLNSITKALLFNAPAPTLFNKNGRAERKHRHILDSLRVLLLSTSCPEKFWGEAALTSVYTINRLPSFVLQNISPFERLYGTPPNYSNLKVFCCASFVLLHPHEHTKLEPRACLCCFLGYDTEHKGFRCWDPLSNRLRISRHVTFWEHTMFSRLSSFHSPSLVFNLSSLTHLLTFFLSLSPLLIMSLLNLHLLLQPRTSRPFLMIVQNLLQTPLLVALLG